MIEEVKSQTIRLKNAIVTIHGWSAGTAILTIGSTREPENHAQIWVGYDELEGLSDMLRKFTK